MTKKILAITALLLVFSLTAMAAEQSPKTYASSELGMQINWIVGIKGNTQQYSIDFASFVPANYSKQEIIQSSATRKFSLNKDNEMAEFSFRTDKSETIVYSANVKIDFTETFSQPLAFPVETTPETEAYLKESPLVQITPEIKTEATRLVGSTSDGLEASAKLTEWVYNNIQYDLAYGNANYSSEWVYENRKGTCDEFAHLLIAMARSQGIPARYVSGYVLGVSPSPEYGEVGTIKWVPHGWAELYFPEQGWIQADPTYNELLQLDASHLKMADALDQSTMREKVEGKGEQGVSLSLEKKYEIRMKNYKQFQPLAVEIEFPEEQVENVQKIMVTLRNPSSQIVVAPVEIVLPGGLQTKSLKNTLVHLKPNEEKQIALDAEITFEMQNNTKYTFPIQVQTFGKPFDASFEKVKLSEEQATFNMTQINVQKVSDLITEIPLDFKVLIAIVLVATLALVVLAVLKAR
ncbi:transglutaminase domain-containing protein [Candidatus Micrarchaeota archaeon]|nr:transglutaminase domain-containing protein [Candidatus Micrarchaeota archaeon]